MLLVVLLRLNRDHSQQIDVERISQRKMIKKKVKTRLIIDLCAELKSFARVPILFFLYFLLQQL